jgi:hypothetical protein
MAYRSTGEGEQWLWAVRIEAKIYTNLQARRQFACYGAASAFSDLRSARSKCPSSLRATDRINSPCCPCTTITLQSAKASRRPFARLNQSSQ